MDKFNFPAEYRPRGVTIVCRIGQKADSSIPKERRGLMRKMAHAVLCLLGCRAEFKPFRDRQQD